MVANFLDACLGKDSNPAEAFANLALQSDGPFRGQFKLPSPGSIARPLSGGNFRKL
jgi:hypothetical protein